MYRILRCSSSSASLNHFLQHSTKQQPIIQTSIHSNIHTNTNTNSNTLASQIPKNNIQSTKSTKKQPILVAQSINRTLVSKTQTTPKAAAAAAINNDDLQITGVSADVASIIKLYALKPQTSASLMTLMKTGRGEYLHKTYDGHEEEDDACSKVATDKILMQVAGFLRHELPIRLAHRIQDLERVPFMKEMKSVQQVKELYITSFLELVSIDKKISNIQDEEIFANMLEGIYERHSSVLVQMARGAFELRGGVRNGTINLDNHHSNKKYNTSSNTSRKKLQFDLMEETHAFLDRFYISRIGIRVLIGQYLSLRQKPVQNYIGLICLHSSPYEIVKRAIDDAAFMCTRKYGDSPEVIITGRLDLTFPYVPTHLHYIMLELLKNSMRATVDWHGIDSDYPPIKVVIADGKDNEDVVIKVSDEGGGIPRSNMKRIWSYLFTTADPAIQEGMVAFNENVDHSVDSPLAGLGYGLPISRSYARYFGGDLSLMSMEGYGTDAFVYLTRLGNTREPLPI
jgi:pyruvate dehydrogenase kinase 2/3/4